MENKNESEANEEGKSADPAKAEKAGDKHEAGRTIDDLNLASKRMEEATEKMRVETDRALNFEAKRRAGGVTEAGQQPQVTKEETPKEYNDRIEKEISEGKHGD